MFGNSKRDEMIKILRLRSEQLEERWAKSAYQSDVTRLDRAVTLLLARHGLRLTTVHEHLELVPREKD